MGTNGASGPAVADRKVGEAEDGGLADVRPARAHRSLERAEQQAAELHLLRERLQRVRGPEQREVPTECDRLQRHSSKQVRGQREAETDQHHAPDHSGGEAADAEMAHPQATAASPARPSPRGQRDEQRAEQPARPTTRRPARQSCRNALRAGRRGSAAPPRAACTWLPPPPAREVSGERAEDAARRATASRSGPTRCSAGQGTDRRHSGSLKVIGTSSAAPRPSSAMTSVAAVGHQGAARYR